MIYPIYIYGEDVLRKKADDVALNDASLSQLIDDMFKTMHYAQGVGLAAPQIGISKKIIVVEEEIQVGVLFKGVFINPEIISYGGYFIKFTEGCLSFPELKIEVERPAFIDVKWFDENKEFHRELFAGIKAIILQHEIDHLNGTMFIDRIHPEEKLKLFMKLEDIKNKKIKTFYSIK